MYHPLFLLIGFLILPFLFISDLHCIWAGKCLLINKLNRSCSFLLNTMVSWSKNRNGRQVPSWCTGYAVLPHQFFLSGWMQQNPVAGDQVFVVRYISKEWYFLCRRLATVVDVWGCRQLSVTGVTVFTAYTSVIRPLSCRLYMDGTVFFPVFCMCGAITCLMQVTEKISDWSGYPEQQVRFVSDPESRFVIFSDRRFPLANIPDFRVRIGTHEAVRYPFFRYKCVCLFIALAMPAFFSCLYMMVDRYHACRG